MENELFQGKRVDNGEWITGNRIDDFVTGQVFIHAAGNSVNESDKVGQAGCLSFVAYEVDPDTVYQEEPVYICICDKNCEKLQIGDRVLLFGKVGEVASESGSYGIYFKDGVPWELIKNKIPEIVTDDKIRIERTPHFCYSDKYISFWELMWNFNCCIEDLCEVVEKICENCQ